MRVTVTSSKITALACVEDNVPRLTAKPRCLKTQNFLHAERLRWAHTMKSQTRLCNITQQLNMDCTVQQHLPHSYKSSHTIEWLQYCTYRNIQHFPSFFKFWLSRSKSEKTNFNTPTSLAQAIKNVLCSSITNSFSRIQTRGTFTIHRKYSWPQTFTGQGICKKCRIPTNLGHITLTSKF